MVKKTPNSSQHDVAPGVGAEGLSWIQGVAELVKKTPLRVPTSRRVKVVSKPPSSFTH
jgi:hypothetical protein